MIIKLSKEEITEAILEWTNNLMSDDFRKGCFNTVELLYSNGCEVSWVEPEAKPDAA
jgi:hypothetical protein